MIAYRLHLLILIVFAGPFVLSGQEASIRLENRSLITYPFDDPDPVPILVSNPKIYPYFKFEGYAFEGREADWKVVTLENEHVEVWVLPEVGGKVWGAREKSTGEEFIYRNEVMKFRNIAMRGPWTSGGIEFNFGIIGHHPSTATPVDYALVEEEDGSVSCWVGAIDLPSRTQWRVRIRLPQDKAAFETQALWYNPTALHQSYYNWMTGAAFATDDLEFYCPGDQYLEHNGDPHPWPYEYGRHIASYDENNFLSHKSYHVVGEYNDFFGGYFHDQGYGFGHWSTYDDIPGQKLWLWSLARNGGIWEDLLTDTDGQYIEFQAGRLFNQYSPGGGQNAVTQADFPPHTTDKWRELWFPVKSIGGLSDVSEQAVLHVAIKDGRLTMGINALERTSGTLVLSSGGEKIKEQAVSLDPMGVFTDEIDWPDADRPFRISVAEMGLLYDSDPERLRLARPFRKPQMPAVPQAEILYREGMEQLEFREYAAAEKSLKGCLEANPVHLEALAALAELYYRQGLYDAGLERALFALSIDTYHPAANFVAGILFQAKGDRINALESLGWAARSMTYRSAAYGIMGEITLAAGEPDRAIHYTHMALDYNRYNMQARQVLAVAQRRSGQTEAARRSVADILEIDPLSHFARFEQFLLTEQEDDRKNFSDHIRNELPYQTYLEVALAYYHMGQRTAAVRVLDLAPDQPVVTIWRAFLQDRPELLQAVTRAAPDFVFPFRRESLAALEWANQQRQHWKLSYYLSLNYWGTGRIQQATQLMEALADTPDYPFFYLTRAHTREATDPQGALKDFLRAQQLLPGNWRIMHELNEFYYGQGQHQEALAVSERAYRQLPDNYTLGMDHVRNLLANEKYAAALDILAVLKVLPFEGASESRRLYERAHLGRALEQLNAGQYRDAITTLEKYKEWPERLGVGKPFDPDERLADYLLAYAYTQAGNTERAAALRSGIVTYTEKFPQQSSPDAVLGFALMPAGKLTDLAIHQYGDQAPVGIQWALAYAQGRKEKTRELEMEYARMFDDMDFRFLRAALEFR